jgi:predicted transcriptional regulator
MTESKSYISSPESQNTEWMMTGVVIASPSTGQIKAVMPILNSYSDIAIEQIRPIDADTLSASVVADFESDSNEANVKQCTTENLDAMLNTQQRKTASTVSKWRLMMKNCISLDARHLSIMVGLASLLGAATNMIFSFTAGSQAPQSLVIAVTVAGFIGGRFVSDKLRNERHG